MLKRALVTIAVMLLAALALCAGLAVHIHFYSAPYIMHAIGGMPPAPVCLVPGARVYGDGRLSIVLRDRCARALDLYRAGAVKHILLSGDHGPCAGGEVLAMRNFMLGQGVPRAALLLDYGGYDTYHSMVRARRLYGVGKCVVVTQRFHLYRALYIARKTGLDARGVPADMRKYRHRRSYAVRELLANVKAVFEVAAGREKAALGRCGRAAAVTP